MLDFDLLKKTTWLILTTTAYHFHQSNWLASVCSDEQNLMVALVKRWQKGY
jgi:hypothetical protein